MKVLLNILGPINAVNLETLRNMKVLKKNEKPYAYLHVTGCYHHKLGISRRKHQFCYEHFRIIGIHKI